MFSTNIYKFLLSKNSIYKVNINVGNMLQIRNSSSHSVDLNPGLSAPKHGRQESEEEFDNRYVNYYSRPEIDGWEIRKAMNDMQGMDLVPEPKIIIAALKACRRVNDHSLAVRYLEAIKYKCGKKVKEIYPYLLQEIQPTLDELGISTPEQMGYDEPELALVSPFDIH